MMILKKDLDTKPLDISHSHTQGTKYNYFHFHDFYELFYVMGEDKKVSVNGKTIPVKNRGLFVFGKTDIHMPLLDEKEWFERYVVTFTDDFIKPYQSEQSDLLACFSQRKEGILPFCELDPYSISYVEQHLKAMLRYRLDRKYGSDALCTAEFLQLMVFVNQLFFQNPPQINTVASCVDKVLHYIDENIGRRLTLTEIATENYISVSHLCRIFKKESGVSLGNFIVTKKLLYAKQLLLQGESVTTTAEKIGYGNDVSNFIRLFKSNIGQTPREFKKQQEQCSAL